MRSINVLLLVSASALTSTRMASAAISAFWEHDPITPEAIANDPILANMQSWRLMVTTTANWASAGMEAILPAGAVYYNHPLGAHTRPSSALSMSFPAVEFDTYVSSPGDQGGGVGAPGVLGVFPEEPLPADFGGTSGRFSVAWADQVADPPGVYEIARLTFPNDVLPDVRNLMPDPNMTRPSNTSEVNPESTTIIPDIPEPASLALLMTCGLLLVCRRRRQTASRSRADCAARTGSMVHRARGRQAYALLVCGFTIVTTCFATVSRATITAFWQRNTITPEAIANDPALANMQSWSLMVTYDTGNWVSAGVRATLPVGNFYYHHSLGGDTAPNPNLFTQFPGVQFDTYVTDPTRANTLVLRGHPTSDPVSFGGPSDIVPGRFSVSWANLVNDPPATYEIARLTFPLDVFPHVADGTPVAPSQTYTVNPDQTAIVPQIPEPAALAAFLLMSILVARWRHGSQVD